MYPNTSGLISLSRPPGVSFKFHEYRLEQREKILERYIWYIDVRIVLLDLMQEEQPPVEIFDLAECFVRIGRSLVLRLCEAFKK